NQTEKSTSDLKNPCSSPSAASVCPNAHDSPSSNESPSKRKSVMGSIRTNKLRSINSLRNLRSPTKAKLSDTVAAPCDNVSVSPQTPKDRPSSSLLLGFQESPADKPIFDLSRRDSTFEQSVHRSSPVPIPSSENQQYHLFVSSSVIPAGTVPSSPAPIQKILDLEETENSLSPMLEPANKLEPGRMRLPTPPPVEDSLPDSVQAAMEHYYAVTPDSEDEHPSGKNTAEPSQERQDVQQSTVDEVTERLDDHCLVANKTKTSTIENALVIIGKNYLVKVFHRGDCQRRIEITAYDGHEDGADDELEHILARREEDFAAAEDIMSRLDSFVVHNKDMLDNGGMEMVLDEALAEGLVPKWLDLDLDMTGTKKLQSRVYKAAKMQKRESVWGQHAGLYDGTGYGAGSSSRCSTATDGSTGAACYGRVEDCSSEDGMDKMVPGAYQKPSSFGSMPDSLRRVACMDTNRIGMEEKDRGFALHA
ncbi:uncharacterized protein SETTUDRAFT_95654, partial [Exserohilum turcica Et28A]